MLHRATVTAIFTMQILLRGVFVLMGSDIRIILKTSYVAKGIGIHQCTSVMLFVSDCVKDVRL